MIARFKDVKDDFDYMAVTVMNYATIEYQLRKNKTVNKNRLETVSCHDTLRIWPLTLKRRKPDWMWAIADRERRRGRPDNACSSENGLQNGG